MFQQMTGQGNSGADRSEAEPTSSWYQELAQKGWKHWVTAVIFMGAGIWAGHAMEERQFFMAERYMAYQWLQGLRPSSRILDRTIIVEIEDDEYWEGELAHRQPLSRVFLAKLLRKLDELEPAVIALDFDMRSPVQDGKLRDNKEYEAETSELIETVKTLAMKGRQIVLPTTIWTDAGGQYTEDHSIYDGLLPLGLGIRKGYINLPYDIRMVPMPIEISANPQSKYPLDSFAVAIARALDSHVVPVSNGDKLPYGRFVSKDSLSSCYCVYSSSSILGGANEKLKERFHPRVVIIGGAWHELAKDRGDVVDSYLTPLGSIGGAYIHSNYVESILAQDRYPPVAKIAIVAVELAILGTLAVIFTLRMSLWIKPVTFVVACGFLLVLSYILLQNFGVFFDPVLPLLALLAHTAGDKIWEWRENASENAKYKGSHASTGKA